MTLFVAIFFMLGSPAQACDEGCHAAVSPRVQSLIESIAQLDPTVMNPGRQLKWQDFDALEKVRAEAAALRADVGSIDVGPIKDPRIEKVAAGLRTPLNGRAYSPTEYELKLQYLYAVNDLNAVLPASMKLSFARVPFDQRRRTVNEKSRALVRALEPKFEQVFNARPDIAPSLETGAPAVEGHQPSFTELTRAIRSNGDLKTATDFFDRGGLRAAIRRPESARFWTPKVGFQNQYVTGTSYGYLNKEVRQHAEAKLLGGLDPIVYALTDFEVMPKYATLVEDPALGLAAEETYANDYGSDAYYLKLENFQDRLTFTISDSLNSADMSQGDWEELFIPWKYRDIVIPFLAEGMKVANYSRPFPSPVISSKWATLSTYWELQIFGSLRMSDVDAFMFEVNPPEGDFLKDLKGRNIKIYDGRTKPARLWTGEPK